MTLSLELSAPWDGQRAYQTQCRDLRAEAARVRQRLAELLYEMRRLLSVPGCCGRFSEYLRLHRIPRSTAHRLIALHERILNPDTCTVETIPEPTDAQIRKLAKAILPRIQCVIPTVEFLDQLFIEVRARFEQEMAERAQAQAAAATVVKPSPEDGEPVVPVPAENTVPWLLATEAI